MKGSNFVQTGLELFLRKREDNFGESSLLFNFHVIISQALHENFWNILHSSLDNLYRNCF